MSKDKETTSSIRLTGEQEKFVLKLRKKDEFCRSSLTKIAHYIFDLGVEAAKRDGKIA
jgi:hypothetical protein